MGGPGGGKFLRSLLTTTAELNVDAALDWYGLKLERGILVDSEEANSEPVQSSFGAIWDEGEPGLVVKAVLAGSGGAIAGLMPRDEILAIGNERLTTDTLDSLMISFRPGDETTLLVSRRNRIISLDIKLDTALPERYEIVRQSKFKKSHLEHLQSLLGQELSQR